VSAIQTTPASDVGLYNSILVKNPQPKDPAVEAIPIPLLFYMDELKQMILKMSIEGSALGAALNQYWSSVKKCALLKNVTWHIFRHTYISRLVMAGVDLRTVQELAGHKDIKMTTRYAHLAPAHKLAAVDRLAEYRKEQEKAEAKKTSDLTLVSA
jgi:hypothetical protein